MIQLATISCLFFFNKLYLLDVQGNWKDKVEDSHIF